MRPLAPWDVLRAGGTTYVALTFHRIDPERPGAQLPAKEVTKPFACGSAGPALVPDRPSARVLEAGSQLSGPAVGNRFVGEQHDLEHMAGVLGRENRTLFARYACQEMLDATADDREIVRGV